MTKQFAGYMKNVTASSATSLKHLLSGYDWASLKDATVVDVRHYCCPLVSLCLPWHI
jgi:6-hydroxytryprostatin B O-methyltransferase